MIFFGRVSFLDRMVSPHVIRHRQDVSYRPDSISWADDTLRQDDISRQDAIVKQDEKGNSYDARAGLRRNELIAQRADLVIAFWDGQSKGTKQIISYARQIGKEVQIVKYKEAAQLKFPF